jgi:tripartite-type tricarboxylate transporter receptor subunit TctC
MLRRTLLRILPLVAAGLPLAAQAQDEAASYPEQVVTLVVPFPAGGSSDTMGRLVAQELSTSLGQQFIVENKPGANGNIGAAQVARAEPDGHTLLLSGVGSNAINYTLYPKLGYEPKDLAHVTLLATGPNVLVANPELEAKSFKAFLELAKAQPGAYNSPAPATAPPAIWRWRCSSRRPAWT